GEGGLQVREGLVHLRVRHRQVGRGRGGVHQLGVNQTAQRQVHQFLGGRALRGPEQLPVHLDVVQIRTLKLRVVNVPAVDDGDDGFGGLLTDAAHAQVDATGDEGDDDDDDNPAHLLAQVCKKHGRT